MVTRLENDIFDIMVEPSDWRYSAAIVGLSRYFEDRDKMEDEDYEVDEDCIKFCSDSITKEEFLLFAESYYGEEFPHVQVEEILSRKEFSKEMIDLVNKLLKENSIMKKVFSKKKFDGSNQEELLELIDENRLVLIRETFRNKKSMYANFANESQLFQEKSDVCCRLQGYYVDPGRKSRGAAFAFNNNINVVEDSILLDFVPFGFFGEYESFFVNDSYSVKELIHTNDLLAEKMEEERTEEGKKIRDARKILFRAMQESADFINYDVEVILKERPTQDKPNDFFQTLFIREHSIQVLRDFKKHYKPFCFKRKMRENYDLDIQKEVIDCILNLKRADELILFFLREESAYLVDALIKLNQYIEGSEAAMEKGQRSAFACAKELIRKLPENKRRTYRQRLTSTLILKDYTGYLNILVQLANYADMIFDFAFDLFEDFEKNMDIAYAFVNALGKVPDKKALGSEKAK